MEGTLLLLCLSFIREIQPFFSLPQAEQNSVSELQTLLTRTIEALSFVLLLNDYRLGELITKYTVCLFS